jgi:hypothetical protein
MKILLGDFNAKTTTGNEGLHEISNDNGVRVVNFATSKNLTVKSTKFPYHSIHKFTSTIKITLGHMTRRGTQLKLYKTVTLLCLMYGRETRTLRTDEGRLQVAEMRFLL